MENSVYRLADAIKKTQKRANALKNIMIPRFEETVKFITNALEEKEREDFSRLKVIRNRKRKNSVFPGKPVEGIKQNRAHGLLSLCALWPGDLPRKTSQLRCNDSNI